MSKSPTLSRKQFIASMMLTAAAGTVPAGYFPEAQEEQDNDDITIDDLKAVERMAGFQLSEKERGEVLSSVRGFRDSYAAIKAAGITNSVAPPTPFMPIGRQPAPSRAKSLHLAPKTVTAPERDEDLAFLPVAELGVLIRDKRLSPVELTKLYLNRLEKYGEKLLNVVTITTELALKQAEKSENEIMSGDYRGPLHGIPYGLKDLFAVKDYPTTWGSEPHKEQKFNYNSAVFEKLTEAGAICCAKLSMGSLAMGDVWYKGRTKNPWDPARGSSGSSAGSCSAMAAGLVAFTIGTETQGSIVSPSHRCRVTGLRPTFGRVSRHGAMVLSWSMDKAGPICRTAEDCAIVLDALSGSDPRDQASVDRPLHWDPNLSMKGKKVGVFNGSALSEFDGDTGYEDYLKILQSHGAELKEIQITQPNDGVHIDLSVECAAAFDDFTRSNDINDLKNSAWPRIFRAHRYVTAVEYLQAMRARVELMAKFEEEFADFDFIATPARGSYSLFITNRTGHPQISVPFGEDEKGRERSFSLIGRLYDEPTICSAAWLIQQETGFYRLRPNLSDV